MSDLAGKKVIVIGGSSGIGFVVAQLVLELGGEVVIASRSLEKLNAARDRLGGRVNMATVDMCSESSLKTLFEAEQGFSHLVVTASDIEFGPIADLPIAKAKRSFDSKFWGPYTAVKQSLPYIDPNGSVVLFSGGFSQHPKVGAAVIAAINGAIESLGKAMALELAPIRVNVVSPGLTDTEHFDHFSDDEKKAFFSDFCKDLPIPRPAQPDEIANAAIYCMTNTYSTGATLYVDGGYTV